MQSNNEQKQYAIIITKLVSLVVILTLALGIAILFLINGVPDFLKLEKENPEKDKAAKEKVAEFNKLKSQEIKSKNEKINVWIAPDISSITNDENSEQIKYGRELIANTAKYFGPKGSIAHISNGMNCQNCHLDAGTKPFGNNYSAVASTYPKFRE